MFFKGCYHYSARLLLMTSLLLLMFQVHVFSVNLLISKKCVSSSSMVLFYQDCSVNASIYIFPSLCMILRHLITLSKTPNRNYSSSRITVITKLQYRKFEFDSNIRITCFVLVFVLKDCFVNLSDVKTQLAKT